MYVFFSDKQFFIKIIKYLISGGIAACVNLITLYMFTERFHFWYIYSSWVAFVITFVVSFSLQRFWTFRGNQHRALNAQLLMYFVMAIVNIILNTGILYILSEFFHLYYLISQAISIGTIAIASFFLYQKYVFAEVGTKQ